MAMSPQQASSTGRDQFLLEAQLLSGRDFKSTQTSHLALGRSELCRARWG